MLNMSSFSEPSLISVLVLFAGGWLLMGWEVGCLAGWLAGWRFGVVVWVLVVVALSFSVCRFHCLQADACDAVSSVTADDAVPALATSAGRSETPCPNGLAASSLNMSRHFCQMQWNAACSNTQMSSVKLLKFQNPNPKPCTVNPTPLHP